MVTSQQTHRIVDALADAFFAGFVLIPLAWIGKFYPGLWALAHAPSLLTLLIATFSATHSVLESTAFSVLNFITLVGDVLLLLATVCNLFGCCEARRAHFLPGYDVCGIGLSRLFTVFLLVVSAVSFTGSVLRFTAQQPLLAHAKTLLCITVFVWSAFLITSSPVLYIWLLLQFAGLISLGVAKALVRVEVSALLLAFLSQAIGFGLWLGLVSPWPSNGGDAAFIDSFSPYVLLGLLAASAGISFKEIPFGEIPSRRNAREIRLLGATLICVRLATMAASATAAFLIDSRLDAPRIALGLLSALELAVLVTPVRTQGVALALFSALSASTWGWFEVAHRRWLAFPGGWALVYLVGLSCTVAWGTMHLFLQLQIRRLPKTL